MQTEAHQQESVTDAPSPAAPSNESYAKSARVLTIGIASTGCVEATMRDACHHDFYAVLLEDAVAGPVVERHEAVLTAMRHRHDVCAVDDAHRTWERAVARVLAGSRR